VIGWETDWGRAVEKHPQPAEAIAPKPVVASLLPEFTIAGGVAARTETAQRTLFNPTRRPAPAVSQVGAERLQRGQFALTGTMLVDGKSTAFLRELAGNKARRVQAGEKINGLLVAEVRPDRVRLTLGEESEELMLKVATNPRPTAPPAAVAQVATPPAGMAPAGMAPPPPAAAAAAAAGADATQSLAERRRAARAAAAASQAAPPPAAATAPAPTAVPAPAAPAGATDPRWEQLNQRYRERAAAANRGNTP
jgi:hypothetical protein